MSKKLTEITYEHLTIAPFNETRIYKLEIIKEINEHGTLLITGLIEKEKKDEYMAQAKFGTVVKVEQKKDEEEKVIFSGILRELKIEAHEGNLYKITVNAITHTYLMDIKIKRRTFQDITKTYKELVEEITEEYGGGMIYKAKENPELGGFTIQYNTSDWGMVRRLSSHFNEGLYPSFHNDKVEYFFGMPKLNNEQELEEEVFIVEKKVTEYKVSSENYVKGVKDLDFVYYEVESYKQLEVGEKVKYRDIEFYVRSAKYYMKKGTLVHRYKICTENGLKQKYEENEKLQGVSIFGHVLDIKRDKIKAHIDEIDEVQDIGKAYWFPYSAMYASDDGSGWYCMPEKGDSIKVTFPNNNENEAFTSSSVSKYDPKVEDPKEDRMGDTSVRYIRNPQGMEVTLTPESVIITSGGAGVIVMDDKGNIYVHANKEINIKSDEDIIISAGKTLNIVAEKSIKISCGEKAEIEMDEEGKTYVKGNEVYTN
jgi:hypothetical protein